MNNQDMQLQAIDMSQLEDVTGGGWKGTLLKYGKKAVTKGVPWVGHKAVDVAKWTGIPAAVGVGASWVKHRFD